MKKEVRMKYKYDLTEIIQMGERKKALEKEKAEEEERRSG